METVRTGPCGSFESRTNIISCPSATSTHASSRLAELFFHKRESCCCPLVVIADTPVPCFGHRDWVLSALPKDSPPGCGRKHLDHNVPCVSVGVRMRHNYMQNAPCPLDGF